MSCHQQQKQSWRIYTSWPGRRCTSGSFWKKWDTNSPPPLQTVNSMAEAVVNGKIQPDQTKAMDMRFQWLKDQGCQKQFIIYQRPRKPNYADHWTKHNPSKHHRNTWREFLMPHIILEKLRIEQRNPTTKPTQMAWHKSKALAKVWWYEQETGT